MGTGPVTKNNIVKREIKIFIIGLQKNNPEIIPDPSVKYLRKCNFPQQHVFFLPVSYIIYMQKTLCVAYVNVKKIMKNTYLSFTSTHTPF